MAVFGLTWQQDPENGNLSTLPFRVRAVQLFLFRIKLEALRV
jgi:hypothetical protein